MKFFVTEDIYNDRIKICKGCDHYFKPTGNCKICKCFMKIKARLAPMSCPKKYWNKTTEVKANEDLPQDLIDEIIKLYPDIETGRATNQEARHKMIELYNITHNTNYLPTTGCSSCVATCFDGIKKLYNKYNKK
tara:strand:- start:511 stop:912 length:402 start_codon:yes stop_codon:yes gene_type:complete